MTREELLNIIETDHVQCGEAAALARIALAFYEWHDKTAWVQTDKRFDVLTPWGKHRADVLKEYIEYLENRIAMDSKPVVIPESCSAQFGNFQHYWHSKGYVLVPNEPTEAMCDIRHIGVDVYCGITDDNEYYSIGGADAAKVWKAMLAAAPQAPGSEPSTVPEVKP